MSDYFKYKELVIWQNECALKVGTDGVLTGEWACRLLSEADRTSVDNSAINLLDIGTGTGLISLMIARQFHNLSITAIDIDEQSVRQAMKNVQANGFYERIKVHHADFVHIDNNPNIFNKKFNFIVTNPPFYEEDTHGDNAREDAAKHTTALTFTQLIDGVCQCLTADGMFMLILPHSVTLNFIALCAERSLYLTHRCNVYTSEKNRRTGTPKRTLLAFSRHIIQTNHISDIVLI